MANETTPSLKGTRTEKNLAKAYVSESIAVTRYTVYGKVAAKENYFHFSDIFKETADNEMHHAKIYLAYLKEGGVKTDGIMVDSGDIHDTLTNIKIAAEEEKVEGAEFYIEAAAVAREEGFNDIAVVFSSIAKIEEHHRRRFLEMARQIEEGTVWKRKEPIAWQCEVCGYIFEGTEPPKICPACKHPYQHYFPEAHNV